MVSVSISFSCGRKGCKFLVLIWFSSFCNDSEVPYEKMGRGGRCMHSCILIIIDKLPTFLKPKIGISRVGAWEGCGDAAVGLDLKGRAMGRLCYEERVVGMWVGGLQREGGYRG